MREIHPERYQRVRELFMSVCEHPPEAHAALLESSCGGDESLRNEVQALLAHAETPFVDFDSAAAEFSRLLQQGAIDAQTRRLPEQIDGFRVLRLLGEGGMGAVYLAEQDQPKRTVAIKVIRHGLAAPGLLKRFEHEATVLGRLKHSGIAQIYSVGTAETDFGPQPYLVMEYVDGATLPEYLRDTNVDRDDRLRLFTKICDAVHHAHQRGVIHRDLKPANIMIDAEGNPKILDFGIARITDTEATLTTIASSPGQVLGTLAYMSPEQAEGDPAASDVRSDVYSLGVILFEMLSNRLPHDFGGRMLHDAMRAIREDDPIRLGVIDRTLAGDLETIVATTLERDPARRYQSVSEFAADVERHLRNEIILARPASAAHRLRKFIARNRLAVGAAVAIALTLIVATLVAVGFAFHAVGQRVIAENERDRAFEAEERAEIEAARALAAEVQIAQRVADLDKVAQFQASTIAKVDLAAMGAHFREELLGSRRVALAVFGMAEEDVQRDLEDLAKHLQGIDFTGIARESLRTNIFDRAIPAIDEFADQPLVHARLLQTFAVSLYSAGLLEQARELHRDALAIRRAHLGDDHEDTLTSIYMGCILLQTMQRLDEAAPLCEEALERSITTLADDHALQVQTLISMSGLRSMQGLHAEAEQFARDAFDASILTFGEEDERTLSALSALGNALRAHGKLEEAGEYYQLSLTIARRMFDEGNPFVLRALGSVAASLVAQGRLAEAEPYARDALEGYRILRGHGHSQTLAQVANYGALLYRQNRLADAEPYYVEAVDGYRALLGSDHPTTMTAVNNLALLLRSLERFAEVEPLYEEILDHRTRLLGADHPETLMAKSNYGMLMQTLNHTAEAESYHRAAWEGRQRTLGESHPHTLQSAMNLSAFLLASAHYDEVVDLLERSLPAIRSTFADDNGQAVETALLILGSAHAHLNHFAEAETILTEACELLLIRYGEAHTQTLRCNESIARLYEQRRSAESADKADAD